jgi:predicted LPLAT superfamily acyltransferase
MWFLLVARARRGSMKYLEVVRGRRGFFRRWWETYRHFAEFGYLLLDRALMLARAGHGYQMECSGLEHLARADREAGDGGIVLLSAHFGNAEIGAPYMRQMGYGRAVHIVMYQTADGTERFHTKHREMLAEMPIISTTDPVAAAAKIMGALKKGGVVAMRADRTLAGKGVAAEFFGKRVLLPAGPFVTAVASGLPVLDFYTCRLGKRRYACRFSEARRYGEAEPGTREERIARAAQDYATHLEKLLNEFPFQWSNFYDYWHEQAPPPPAARSPAEPS